MIKVCQTHSILPGVFYHITFEEWKAHKSFLLEHVWPTIDQFWQQKTAFLLFQCFMTCRILNVIRNANLEVYQSQKVNLQSMFYTVAVEFTDTLSLPTM